MNSSVPAEAVTTASLDYVSCQFRRRMNSSVPAEAVTTASLNYVSCQFRLAYEQKRRIA